MKIEFMQMTNENIDYLIKCEKDIVSLDKKDFKIEQGHKKNGFKLKSIDQKHKFSVFMRVNCEFEENFSIGLIYHPLDDKSIMLFRCNGPHNHIERPDSEHYVSFHYHYEREENILEGLNPMNHTKIVEDYSTFKEAFHFFITHCRISNAEEFFPNFSALVLSFMDE